MDQILAVSVCFRLGKWVCYETTSLRELKETINKVENFCVANGFLRIKCTEHL